MELIQNLLQNLNIDLGSGVTLALCCSLLCVGVFVIGFFFQVVGGFFEIFFGLFGAFFDVLSGGPVAWCGCLLLVGAILVCGLIAIGGASLLSTCGTPEQVNLCRLFGY